MPRAAVIQSSYIPWKGYFDVIALSDHFVLYDDVQFTKNDWRNRNMLKTARGTAWLTIPVLTKGRFGQAIQEVEVVDSRWAKKHWRSIQSHYARAPYFDELAPRLESLYQRAADERLLSRINEMFIREICDVLDFSTRIVRVDEFELVEDRNQRLIDLCGYLGADEYISGPAAQAYLDVKAFEERGIGVRWMDYSGYPEYHQLHDSEFVHGVTILDLLLNEGADRAPSFLLSSTGDPLR